MNRKIPHPHIYSDCFGKLCARDTQEVLPKGIVVQQRKDSNQRNNNQRQKAGR